MTDIETYLGSPQAVADVGALLATSEEQDHAPCILGDAGWLRWHRRGAWSYVVMAANEEACVYFRPEGNRYVVTDLGEATRALRLRTGRLTLPPLPLPPDIDCIEGVIRVATIAPDLPQAICRVLLAAWGVGRLNERDAQ